MSELELVDPSFEFGRKQGLFVYDMARSMDEGSVRPDRPVTELAYDAARTAVRIFETENIDAWLAARGILHALEARLNIGS